MTELRLHLFRRRPVLLLEVIIAFALVALCVLPLIYPHVFILRSERQFIAEVKLDHRVNLLYADLLQKLYQKEIPWSDINGGKAFPFNVGLDSPKSGKPDFPFTATYRFEKVKQKAPDDAPHNIYLYKLVMTFDPAPGSAAEKSSKPLKYEYLIPIERRQNE